MRELSIGTAWAEATAGLRRERRLLAPVVLGLILLPSVVSAMIQPQVPAPDAPPGWWMIGVLVALLVTIVGQMAVVLMVDGWRGSVGAAIARSVRRLPVVILAGLMIIVPLILGSALLVAALGGASGATVKPEQLSGTALLISLVLVIAVLVIAVRLLPITAFAATRDDGAVRLLRQSWAATRGHFWKLLGFFLLWAIAFVVATLAVGAVIGTMIVLLFGRPEPWSVPMVILALVSGLVQALFVAIYTAMLARIAAQLDPESSNGM